MSQTRCVKCDQLIWSNAKFCPSCGSPISAKTPGSLNYGARSRTGTNRWIALSIMIVVIASIGGLVLWNQYPTRVESWHSNANTSAPQPGSPEYRESERVRLKHEANERLKDLSGQVARMEESMNKPKMNFQYLRRFADSNQWGVYEATLNYARKVVLIGDPSHIVTDGLGFKSYFGSARPLGEKPYILQNNQTKYADTFEMEFGSTQEEIDKVKSEIRKLESEAQATNVASDAAHTTQ